MQHVFGNRNFTAGNNIKLSRSCPTTTGDQPSPGTIIRLQVVQISLLALLAGLTIVQHVQNQHLQEEIDDMRHLAYRAERVLSDAAGQKR